MCLFFWTVWVGIMSCLSYAFIPQCGFPKDRDIFNHSSVMKSRKFSTETVLLPILPSIFKRCQLSWWCPFVALFPFSIGTRPWSYIGCNCCACLASFNQGQFLSPSLWWNWHIGQILEIGCSLFWVVCCLLMIRFRLSVPGRHTTKTTLCLFRVFHPK